jgi:hypothetical protein
VSAPEILKAKREEALARRRLQATVGELQRRLKPATLATNAWEGVTDKAGSIADDAVEAVKARPMAASAAVGAFTLFLARQPIRSAISWLFAKRADEELVNTRLDNSDGHFDLTAPVAVRQADEGVKA